MRYGVFSDVHGNIEALDAVLGVLRDQGVDRYAFVGDAVGYGPNPNEVCDRIREVAEIAVVGNHDAAVTDRMSYEEYYDAARHALDWCKERLTPANMKWLTDLPYSHREGDLVFSHGAPVAPELFDYLFAPEQVVDMLEGEPELAPVTFIGHSHLTISFAIDDGTVTPILADAIECDPAKRYIITDGSVGQPRDRDPRAACGVYDSETRVFTFHRVTYDAHAVRRKILDAGLSPIFGERLLVGM